MEILTKSIQDFLHENMHKKISQVGYQDLLLIEGITIDGQSENRKKQPIFFNELKLLKNLKYLEIRNIVISNYMIKVLEDMDYLENIIFKNCTFRTTISTMNNLKPLNQLRIEDCKNFNLEYINSLTIKNLTLANIEINNFKTFKNNLVTTLDISRAVIKKTPSLKGIKVEKLVLSHKDYNKYKGLLENINYEIIVMADDGFYIEVDI
ncbi:MAG: hypothetical protein IKO49_05985 [Bacilli bacterium]|nr:hypothetical protein [Bacilli bacterium]